ncbi:MAG: glycerol-3-phosphate acyltransferase [Promethearchaeota archaeon]
MDLMHFMFSNIISIILGYFIGCLLPAYLFGRLKGVDIRTVGTCNAGTMNVSRSLGLIYAIPTAIYDTLKGLLAMWIASLLGANFYFIQIAGLMAIVGHVFPFYLKFNGGQGVACAVGIMLFYLVNYLIITQWLDFFLFIVFCLVLVAIFYYITRIGEFLSVLILPLLGFYVLVSFPGNMYNLFLWILLAHIMAVGIYNIIAQKLIIIENEEFKTHWWRTALRPFAVLFLVFHYYLEKPVSIIIIGAVSLAFILMDIFKILSKSTQELLTKRIKTIFRKGEEEKFSSMSAFLVGTFIVLLLFEKDIAITAVAFTIFGDLFSKIFGLGFGKHPIFDKTFEGTLAYFGAVLICWYVLSHILNLNYTYIFLIGAIAAPITELISRGINDNFTVSLISGVIMEVGRFFGL